jgi:hypothetical protein
LHLLVTDKYNLIKPFTIFHDLEVTEYRKH